MINLMQLIKYILTGRRAMTVAFYPEQNVKNGLQYYTRVVYPLLDPIVSGQSKSIIFKTNSKKVLVKVRIVHYSAEELKLELFANPTFDDQTGTPITPDNYNGVNPVTTTVQVYKDSTVSADGTPLDNSDPEHYFGSNSTGQRNGTSIPEGRERVLPENGLYHVKLTNTGTGSARVQYFLDWYEGEPDLPRKE